MIPCVAVFDIGKTNKKCILFDQQYHILLEIEIQLEQTQDEDGEPCENVHLLTDWLLRTWQILQDDRRFEIKALNFTTYGASLVHLDEHYHPVTPLYSYLKPFPASLEQKFYEQYGGKLQFTTQTASPALGMLNSGLQLYWLKYERPYLFEKIRTALHLPQYCSFLFTRRLVTEFTSVGCHTALWDFQNQQYHPWVENENLLPLFPPIASHQQPYTATYRDQTIPAGLGLHDSSSALIPSLKTYSEPFLLLSTGTWGITLNPFARKTLTPEELRQDCLNFLTYTGTPVKASRLFIGNEHENQVKQLALHYVKPADYYKQVKFNADLLPAEEQTGEKGAVPGTAAGNSPILNINLDLNLFDSYEAAYHALLFRLTMPQVAAINLAAEYNVEAFTYLLVDGGFSKNKIFMHLLQKSFPILRISVSETAQGTALGAAMVMNAFAG